MIPISVPKVIDKPTISRQGGPYIHLADWGTLGMAFDENLNFSGTLLVSENGENRSTPDKSGIATVEEIELFKRGRSEEFKQNRIIERFISFENINFHRFPKSFYNPKQIPKLRLTIDVKPDEGALVFYQFHKGDQNRKIEYIQPLPTHNHDCTNREKLTYHIPIYPPMQVINHPSNKYYFQLSQKITKIPMIIKILIGKRGVKNSTSIIGDLASRLYKDQYKLLLWNNQANKFIQKDKIKLKNGAKSLLLLHGTFSSTENAFKPLLSGHNSWIKSIADSENYKHVLAFDHPTVFEGPKENAMILQKMLDIPRYDRIPINILSHSRGGLFTKYLSQRFPNFVVNRAALVACANGVGYFKVGWMVSKILSLSKLIFDPLSKECALISGLAQHSVEWLLNQPGFKAMTPNSRELEEILTQRISQLPAHQCRFLPIVGDYRPQNSWKYPFDFMIDKCLGNRNDWVVGCSQQKNVHPGKIAEVRPNINYQQYYNDCHIDYFNNKSIQSLLSDFLYHKPICL